MDIKTKKMSISIPGWIIFLAILAGDSIYKNYCNTKAYKNYLSFMSKSD